jgi:hypothetical protein
LRRDIQDPEGRETREMPVFPEIKRSGWSCSMIARLGEQKIGLAEANSAPFQILQAECTPEFE